MTTRCSVLPLGFGLSAVLCFASASSADDAPPASRPPVRVYTNEDLARVHPFRSQTGVDQHPAIAVDTRESSRPPRGEGRGRGEEYWRREAARLRERMSALVEQAETLRARIAEREQAQRRRGGRGSRGSATSTADATTAMRVRLLAIERRMRQLEEDFADRTRREGVLPGWLR
jgi:hypothetical protein